MKHQDIQADIIFPLPEDLPEEKDWREEAWLWTRGSDWTRKGPLAALWKLPEPLRTLTLTPVLAGLLFGGIFLLAWQSSSPRRRKRDRT